MTLYPVQGKAGKYIIGEKIEQVVASALKEDQGMAPEEVLDLVLKKIKQTCNHVLGYVYSVCIDAYRRVSTRDRPICSHYHVLNTNVPQIGGNKTCIHLLNANFLSKAYFTCLDAVCMSIDVYRRKSTHDRQHVKISAFCIFYNAHVLPKITSSCLHNKAVFLSCIVDYMGIHIMY